MRGLKNLLANLVLCLVLLSFFSTLKNPSIVFAATEIEGERASCEIKRRVADDVPNLIKSYEEKHDNGEDTVLTIEDAYYDISGEWSGTIDCCDGATYNAKLTLYQDENDVTGYFQVYGVETYDIRNSRVKGDAFDCYFYEQGSSPFIHGGSLLLFVVDDGYRMEGNFYSATEIGGGTATFRGMAEPIITTTTTISSKTTTSVDLSTTTTSTGSLTTTTSTGASTTAVLTSTTTTQSVFTCKIGSKVFAATRFNNFDIYGIDVSDDNDNVFLIQFKDENGESIIPEVRKYVTESGFMAIYEDELNRKTYWSKYGSVTITYKTNERIKGVFEMSLAEKYESTIVLIVTDGVFDLLLSVTTTSAPSQTCPLELIYGKYSEKTELLRYVRNNILSQTPTGREIIKLYYQWSPVIVKGMEEDEEFKQEVREMVDGVLLLIGR